MKTKLFLISLLVLIGLSTSAQWQNTNGPYSGGIVQTLCSNGSNIFCGTVTGGAFINNGSSWSAINNGFAGTSPPVTCITNNGTNLYSTSGDYVSQKVYLSTNNGSNWDSINTGLNNEAQTIVVNGTNLYAGTWGGATGGVFESTNNGANWTALVTGYGFGSNGVHGLDINGNNIIACVFEGAQVSTDNGVTWTWNTFLSGYASLCIARSGSNVFVGTEEGVYLTTDNGVTFNPVNSSMPGKNYVYALAVDGSNIFAGSDSGVYVTSNNGLLWTAVNTGLTDKSIHSLAIYGTDLYAGTATQGVWKRALSQMVSGINEISDKDKMNVYPNPFTDKFSVEDTKAGQLFTLYDITGREIGQYSAKGNVLSINGEGLQRGIYILKDDNGQAAKIVKE